MSSESKPNPKRRLLIVGASVRPWIQSALAAGYQVSAFDFFIDWDASAFADWARRQNVCRESQGDGKDRRLDDSTKIIRLGRFEEIFDDEHQAEVDACDQAIVCGGFETRLPLVRKLESKIRLRGPSSTQLERLLDYKNVERACRKLAIPFPVVRATLQGSDDPSAWLVKRAGSSGGSGVRQATRADQGATEVGRHFEEKLTGPLLSGIFISRRDGNDQISSLLVAMTRQIVGDPEFTSKPFQYCGSVQTLPSVKTTSMVEAIGRKMGAEFRMNGLWGIDFIDTDDGLVPIDINPRLTASMELFETSVRFPGSQFKSLIDLHVKSCRGEVNLSRFRQSLFASLGTLTTFEAKAVLFNRSNEPIHITDDLFSSLLRHFDIQFFTANKPGRSIADVPVVDTMIASAHPILTVRVRTALKEQLENELRVVAGKIRHLMGES